jgi:cell division protein FtsI/penicillin-binding protein 2
LALGFAAVALRLAHLQIIRGGFFVERADRQQLRAVPVLGRRGSIYDRNHEALAQSIETESVFLSNRMAKKDDLGELCASLSRILKVDARGLRHKIATGKSFYVTRSARLEDTAKLKAMKFAALSYEPQSKREYPQGRLACHVLGFAGVDGQGLEGVERQYNKSLAGQVGKREMLVDAMGKNIPSGDSWISRPKDGDSLILTLDDQFQHVAERELEKAWRKSGAKSASIVVMDPGSGEILALANFPDYDPNDGTKSSLAQRRDGAVNDAFEPGSTFKTVTAALALEQGVVDLDTPVDCHQGRAEFAGRIVRDHGDDHMGVVPFREVIANSSNVGTVEVAQKLGAAKLFDGIQRFGFGKPTGIDLPGEAIGTLRPLKDWSPASMASVPYGQELSCNLMHVARLYAAVANGGHLVTPHVVMQTESPSGSRSDAPQKASGQRVLSSKLREQLVQLLEGVVENGTGSTTALPGFKVAGKTGTSQVYNAKAHAYSMNASVSSFAGFVPAEKPAFVCVVMLNQPKGMDLGGWVAGPVFRSCMTAMLAARGVAPDEKLMAAQQAIPTTKATRWTAALKKGQAAAEVDWVKVPDLQGKSAYDAKGLLSGLNLKARMSGQGKMVASQFPGKGSKVREFSTVKLWLENAARPKAQDKVASLGAAAAGVKQ